MTNLNQVENNQSKKKSSLKKILTTASALAMIAGAASDARADRYTNTNVGAPTILRGSANSENLQKSDGSDVNVLWPGGAHSFYFSDTSTEKLGLDDVAVATIDLNDASYNGGNTQIHVISNSSVSSIVTSSGGAQVADVFVYDDQTLTLAGQNGVNKAADAANAGIFSAVNSIALGFGGPVDVNGDAVTNPDGSVTLNRANLVIGVASTVSGTIDTAALVANVETAIRAKANKDGFDANDAVAAAVAQYAGNITVNADTTFKGVLGGNNALGTITANADVTFEAAVTAAQLDFGNNAKATFANVLNGVNGVLTLGGADGGTIDGAVTAATSITVNKDVTFTDTVGNAAVETAQLDINDGSTVTFSKGLNGTGGNTLTLGGADGGKIDGVVTAANSVTANNSVTFTDTDANTAVTTAVLNINNGSTVKFVDGLNGDGGAGNDELTLGGADGGTIDGVVTAANSITVNKNVTFTDTVSGGNAAVETAQLDIKGGSTVKFVDGLRGTGGNTLTLGGEDGGTIDGVVTAANSITANNSVTFTDTATDLPVETAQLNIAAAGKTVTFSKRLVGTGGAGDELIVGGADGVTIDGVVEATTKVTANNSVTFKGDVTTDNLYITDAKTVTLNKDFAGEIDSVGGANTGNLTLNSNLTIAEEVGSNSALNLITANADVTFTKGVKAAQLDIDANRTVTLKNGFDGAIDGVGQNVTLITSDNAGTITGAVTGLSVINAQHDTTFNSTVSTTNLNISANRTVTVEGRFTGDIDGTANNAGILKVDANNVVVDDKVGLKHSLEKIQVANGIAGANFKGYVKVGTLEIGDTVSFNGGLTVGDFTFLNAATISVNGDFNIGSVTDSAANGGQNILRIDNGTGTITSAGVKGKGLDDFSVNNVTATVTDGAYAKTINIANSTVKITKDTTFEGENSNNTATTVIDDSTLDLGSAKLTNTGDVTITGVNNKLEVTLGGGSGPVSGGNILINGDLVFNANSKITVNLSDKAVEDGLNSRVFSLFSATGTVTGASASNIVLYDQQPTFKWDPIITANGISIQIKGDSDAYFKRTLGEEGAKAAGDAAKKDPIVFGKVFNFVGNLAEEGQDEKVTETFDRINLSNKGLVSVASQNLSSSQNMVATRVVSLRAPAVSAARVASSDHVTGVAAGDESTKYGVWVNPFYASANQKEKNRASGYKSLSSGISLGLDNKFSDNLVLGAAITVANSYTKYKDTKSGDKTRFRSLLLSIYNMYNLTENWFMYGSATVGDSKVLNESKRVASATGYDIAEGNHSVTSFGVKEMFGYNFVKDSATITPMAGLKYSRINKIKYQESGSSIQNLKVSTKTMNKLEAVVGASVAGKARDYRGAMFTPEIHGFAEYNLFNKTQRALVELGSYNVSSTAKDTRVSYNVGLGLKAEYKAFEYEFGYDANLADKFVSHQGSLKVRVNF